MVSANVLAGIFGLLGTATLGFIYVTLWIWRHTMSLGARDEERVVELESHQRSNLEDELTKLYMKIDDDAQDATGRPDDIGRREHVANVISSRIGEADIEPVVDELDEIDTPEGLFDSHRAGYQNATRHFMWAAAGTLALGVLIVVQTINGEQTFTATWNIVYFLLVGFVGHHVYEGTSGFLSAQSLKEEFEELWREYKRVE